MTVINIIIEPTVDLKRYDELVNDVKAFMENKDNLTYDDVAEHLKEKPDVASWEMDGGMMYVTSKDGMELSVDLNGVSKRSCEVGESIDVSTISSAISQALGYDKDNAYAPPRIKNVMNNESNDLCMVASAASANTITSQSKPKILYWAPWERSMGDYNYVVKTIKSIAKEQNLPEPTILSGDSCTLESMKNFSNYTLVIIDCHGSSRGDFVVPSNSYWKAFVGKKKGFGDSLVNNYRYVTINGKSVLKKYTENAVLFNPLTVNYVPALEKKTIVWTIMCHAFTSKSRIKSVFKNQGALGFMGANNTVNSPTVLPYLSSFASRFFNKCRDGGFTVEDAFSGTLNTLSNYDQSKPYKYERDVLVEGYGTVKEIVYGNYCYTSYGNSRYRLRYPYNLPPIDNKPRGSYISDNGKSPLKAKTLLKAYVAEVITNQEDEAGFWFKNQSTGEEEHIPFSEESIRSYEQYSYENIITRYVMTGNTEKLIPGKYIYRTYLKTDEGTIYSDEVYKFELKDNTDDPAVRAGLCPDSHHPHAIDLGLGVKWSCCNVGASSPEKYGGYYAWGETEQKSIYWDTSYAYYDNEAFNNGKNWEACFQHLGSDIGGTSYDVAHVKWGGSWRMPSLEHIKALVNNCSSEWTDEGVYYGRKFIGANGNCIFLPAVGYRCRVNIEYYYNSGYYWSSTQAPYDSCHAYSLKLFKDLTSASYGEPRYLGCPVRPVSE